MSRQIATLQPILQRQAPSGRITLNEMYIGDVGAKQVADALRQHPNIGIIDLKSNNIGPAGFIEIFQALKSNISLRSLLLQWNTIALNNNLQALELLFQVMSINKSITHIDLQNNRLNSSSAAILANIIRNNPQLKSLDLRFNELGNQGVRLLIAAISANGYIISVEVQGNGASEDTIRELNQALILNRENNDQDRQGSQQNSRIRYNATNRQPIKEMQQHLEEERRAVAQHLEKLIERERSLGLQLKEEYEEKTQMWRQKQLGNSTKIEALEKNIAELQNLRNVVRTEITRWEDEIKNASNKKTVTYKAMEERLQACEQQLRERDREMQSVVQNDQKDHFYQLRELDNEWGQKCEAQMTHNRDLEDFNQELLNKINTIQDSVHSFKKDSATESMELIEKVKNLVLSEFKEKLRIMEAQVEQIDADRLSLNRKHQETLLEAQRDYRKLIDQNNDMRKDSVRINLENQSHELHSQRLLEHIQVMEQDIKFRTELETNLQKDLNKLKEKEFSINDQDSQQVNALNNLHRNEQTAHIKLKEDLKYREEALDKTLRDSLQENHRLNTDIKRLIELLQANTTKAIFSTFSEHSYI